MLIFRGVTLVSFLANKFRSPFSIGRCFGTKARLLEQAVARGTRGQHTGVGRLEVASNDKRPLKTHMIHLGKIDRGDLATTNMS